MYSVQPVETLRREAIVGRPRLWETRGMTKAISCICAGLLFALACSETKETGSKEDKSTGAETKSGEAKSGEAESGEAKTGETKTGETPAPVAPAEPAEPTEDRADPAASTMEKLAAGETRKVDLDGDGSDETVSVSKSEIVVGAAKVSLDVDARVFLLDLNPQKPKQQILVAAYGEEDSVQSTVYEYKGGKLRAAGSFYGGGEPEAKGGLLVSNQWNCTQRDGRAFSFDVVQTWALRKGKLVKLSEKKGKEKDIGEFCPACPFVYVATDQGWRYTGEILRSLVGASMETTQSLRLPLAAVRDGVVRVKLAEEKREISFVDDIHLEVDGQAIAPQVCPFCERAGDRLRLAEGESLELRFVLPPDSSPASIKLVARGYYLPLR